MSSWWLLVGFAVFCAGLAKSGFGSGLGLFAVPLVTLAMDRLPGHRAADGIGLLSPLLVVGDLTAVVQYRRFADWRIVRKLAAGTLAGVVVGAALLYTFTRLGTANLVRSLILIEIGCECVGLVGLHWWVQRHGRWHRLWPEPLRSRLTGTFAGASSTLAHGAGPIVASYLLPLDLTRQGYVGTSAAYFFSLNAVKVVAYAATGEFARTSFGTSAWFLPALAVGATVGYAINRRLKDTSFTRFIYAGTFALGWYVLADGLWGLWG